MSMEELAGSLGALEALRWFLIPAALQWFILQETVAGRRWLRWIMLLTLWVPLQLVLWSLLLVSGGGLLVAVLFQLEFADLLSGAAGMMVLMLAGSWRLFARFGLLLAGWGSAWTVFRLRGSYE